MTATRGNGTLAIAARFHSLLSLHLIELVRFSEDLVHGPRFFLPTNLTNLHETFSMNLMATYTVARIFTNSMILFDICCVRHYAHCVRFLDIFGCARQSPNKFDSALACT